MTGTLQFNSRAKSQEYEIIRDQLQTMLLVNWDIIEMLACLFVFQGNMCTKILQYQQAFNYTVVLGLGMPSISGLAK